MRDSRRAFCLAAITAGFLAPAIEAVWIHLFGPALAITFGAGAIALGAAAAFYNRPRARRSATITGVAVWVAVSAIVAAVALFTATVTVVHTVSTGDLGLSAPSPTATASSTQYQINVVWPAIPGATRYQIQRQVSGGGFSIHDSNVSAVTSTDLNLPGGLTYGYQVKACNTLCSSWSATTSALVIPPPPASPTLNPHPTSIGITWTAPTSATKYDVQHSMVPAAYATVSLQQSGLSFNDTGLLPNTNYGYQVDACNATGCSPYSTPNTTWTTPGAATLSGSVGGTSANLSWNVPAGASTQTLQISETLPPTVTDSFDRADSASSLGSTTDTTAQAWTADSGTWGISSNQAYLPSGAGGTNRVAVAGSANPDGFVQFTTGPNATGGYGAAFRAQDANHSWVISAQSGVGGVLVLAKLLGESLVGVNFIVSDTLQNSVIRTEYSGSSIVVKVNGTQVMSSTDAQLSGATGVGLYAASNVTSSARWDAFSAGPTQTVNNPTDVTGQTTYTDTNLALSGSSYAFVLSTCNGHTCSTSNSITGYPDYTAPNLSATVASATQVDLSWNKTGLSAIGGYEWTYRLAGGSWTAPATGTTTAGASKTGLSAGTAYEFRVRACYFLAAGTCIAGISPWTTALATTTPTSVPGAPTNVAGIPALTSVALTWDKPPSDGGTIIDYRIHAYTGGAVEIGGSPRTVGAAENAFVYPGLVTGVAYKFSVEAVNAAGHSTPSSLSSFFVTGNTNERLAPDAVLSSSNLTSPTVTPIQDDPDYNGSDVTALNGTSDQAVTRLLVSFPTPSGPLTGTQEFKVFVKKRNHIGSSTNSHVTVRLYEDGSPVSSSDDNTVTATLSSGLISYTWNADTVTNAANVELMIDQTSGTNVTTDIYAVEWSAVENPTFNAPNAPIGVTAAAGSGEASISWSAPGTVYPDILTVDYRVYVYDGSGSGAVGVLNGTNLVRARGSNSTSSTYVFNGLRPGVTYTFKVQSYNGAGWGQMSAASNAVTVTS